MGVLSGARPTLNVSIVSTLPSDTRIKVGTFRNAVSQ